MIKTLFSEILNSTKSSLTKIFGSSNDRIIKSIASIVKNINELEPFYENLSDAELSNKTNEFRSRIDNGQSIDDILVEAFATVREASKRVIFQRHFDVQLIGGVILHRGMISEMKTGEGKTLTSTLAVYLNAISGKGVHVVTVNDYLAKRDSAWMGKIYNFLGLSVGCITNELDDINRKNAYECDITYGTNNEFGFDYLRDNLKFDLSSITQRAFNYAIIDEVDSILIDEARTPLIISGPTNDNSKLYSKIDQIIPLLSDKNFEIDEKSRSCMLTDHGHESIEEILRNFNLIQNDSSLYDLENIDIVHHVNQALKAHKLFSKDVDYIVKDDKVMIIDEFTGRVMDGRRYSEGLHQAIEAKEKVIIQNENQTLASVTFQNYFRLYPKLAGMTGTALTEASEFNDIYRLEVVSVPTNIAVKRKDLDDEIYLTSKDKYNAIVKEILEINKSGQPILVGTTSIEKSELLSSLLKAEGIKHNVLNAKYHEQEAYIIAQAGRLNAVTIATNMAGRGTDIMLGGNPEMIVKQKNKDSDDHSKIKDEISRDVAANKEAVLNAGGLYVLGTERHESRRIDNQLRGRSGRQGDPGKTKFYLSMDDDLMRIFGSEKIRNLLSKLGLKDGEFIIHPWISKSIEKAQQKVEARNYETRKTLLKFDDVMNEQRKVIYDQRKYIMTVTNLADFVKDQIEDVAQMLINTHIPSSNAMIEEWDVNGLTKELHYTLATTLEPESILAIDNIDYNILINMILKDVFEVFESKNAHYGKEVFEETIRHILMFTLDNLWRDHLNLLDHLRLGIGLRAYGQKDPLNEYKIDAFQMFKNLLNEFSVLSVQRILHVQISREKELNNTNFNKLKTLDKDELTHISRNSSCPCGSGKRFKHCHGKIDQ